ncbi:MAG: radical SAM protein [Leptospiraceae bacterium]|nr:radical SAM protein [Leptospiraceae bacterium]MCP5495523.1 radical SAM protein [Leptospiraceae bacterium]
MPRLNDRDYTYFTTVRGMCRQCRKDVPARVYFQGEKVWQQSICPDCENQPALISIDKDWYLKQVLQKFPDNSPLKHSTPMKHGCPHDCGPCNWHASKCQLPVFSITNQCNLFCPICFTYNNNDKPYNMSLEELNQILDWIVESSGTVDLIDITGGEPTSHPNLIELLKACKRPEIGRIMMNSNGTRLAKDYELCEKLAELGVYVSLSLNTFQPQTSIDIHGIDLVEKKLQAIENLKRAGVKMTIITVLMRDKNTHELQSIFSLMREYNHILSWVIQTMTYTGQGGGDIKTRNHIPVDEAAQMVCESSDGILTFDDFVTRPSAHPLCYLTSYLLKVDDRFLPFKRFLTNEKIQSYMKDSYLMRIDTSEEKFFKDVINDLYAKGQTEDLKVFKKLLSQMYPPGKNVSLFERQQMAEAAVRMIYVHTHMDEDNFDSFRAMLCPDLVPAEPGKLIPACTYNLFYRRNDPKFYGK